jgi:hypothetical protein
LRLLTIKQALIRLCLKSRSFQRRQTMRKTLITSIAAVAALTLSGGAFAQAAGGAGGAGSSGANGSTASPSNQVNGGTNGYGSSGMTNSDSGRAPNSGLPANNADPVNAAPAPQTNNTLATPSVVSPAAKK